MRLNRAVALLTLLLLMGSTWGAVTFSKETIECCKVWQSEVTVTKANGEPYNDCKIFYSVMETKAGIETTLTQGVFRTNSSGKAILSYTPSKPGERLRLSISCGEENKVDKFIPVMGNIDGPAGLDLNINFPPIETSQMAVVAFAIVGGALIIYRRKLGRLFMMPAGKKAVAKTQDSEGETSPRRLILDHERKVAAKLARKHRRKEIRLGHEFVRKL